MTTEERGELVTVVIPARNEEAFIGPCLDSILAQTHRELQVIVVDGESTDRTAAIVEGYRARDERVELIANPRRIVPTGLNLALAAARARWLVRVDAHAVIPPDYVRLAVEHLRSGRWGGVGGRKDGIGTTPAGKAIAAVMASRFGVGGSVYHYGTAPMEVEHVPFGAYPVDVARAIGGWDEDLAVNQDFEFDHRVGEAGHKLLFDPALVIHWHCRQSVRDLWRQYHRYGRGKVAVMALHPESIRPRHLIPPAFVAALAGSVALAPRRRAPAVALGAAYGAALTVATVSTIREVEGGAARMHVPAAFAAMHVGWGVGAWGGVRRMLAGRLAGGEA